MLCNVDNLIINCQKCTGPIVVYMCMFFAVMISPYFGLFSVDELYGEHV